VEAYQHEALASDPVSGEKSPPAFRAPSGAMEDAFYLASGRQLWDAASITARVLIIRSGNDFWSRPEDVARLQEHLVNAAAVRVATIPNATHYVHLDRQERGRAKFLEEVAAFLSQPAR
jgi:pimeloyl-ACP methyl ester carboxylesterase